MSTALTVKCCQERVRISIVAWSWQVAVVVHKPFLTYQRTGETQMWVRAVQCTVALIMASSQHELMLSEMICNRVPLSLWVV